MKLKKDLEKIVEYFGKINNFLVSGRQGLFKYVDMDLAMEMGFNSAGYFLQRKNTLEYPMKTDILPDT